MATTATDNVVVRMAQPVPAAIDKTGSNDINQGDQVYFDTTAHQVKALGASDDTNAANFYGVAGSSSYIQPYATKVYADMIPVYNKGIFRFKTTAGDTYTNGNKVYVGADAQTVTNTVGGLTKVLGIVVLPPGITSLAGASGVFVEVQIAPLYPVASL